MRLTIGLLATSLALATPVVAQSTTNPDTMRTMRDDPDDPRRGGLIIKAGFSFGGVSNSGLLPGETSDRNGFALGVGLVTSAPFGLGIEGLYAQRGVTGSGGGARQLDYIDVPVYLRLGATNPSAEPFIYAGPMISFELKCDADGSDCPSGRDNVSYAGIIGAGLRFPTAAGLSVEARYLYGLSDLKLGTVTDDDSYQTRSFQLLFGFGF